MRGLSGGPVVVVYHHLSECRDPLVSQLGVTTDPDVFVRHMRYFARNFDLVSAADLVGGAVPRRALLVTFDDAYRSVLDVGGPILRELNAPSIFFLNPGTVSSDSVPIDNLLSLAVDRLGLAEALSRLGPESSTTASVGDVIWERVSGLGMARTEEMKARVANMLGTTPAEIRRHSGLFMNESDVKSLGDYDIDVGNHSMSHSFFRSLSTAELTRQIQESRSLLQRMSARPVTCLSVPYGHEMDAPASVLDIARGSGHRAIFLVHGRSNRFRPAPDIFYRTSPKNARPGFLPFAVRVMPSVRTIVNRLR